MGSTIAGLAHRCQARYSFTQQNQLATRGHARSGLVPCGPTASRPLVSRAHAPWPRPRPPAPKTRRSARIRQTPAKTKHICTPARGVDPLWLVQIRRYLPHIPVVEPGRLCTSAHSWQPVRRFAHFAPFLPAPLGARPLISHKNNQEATGHSFSTPPAPPPPQPPAAASRLPPARPCGRPGAPPRRFAPQGRAPARVSLPCHPRMQPKHNSCHAPPISCQPPVTSPRATFVSYYSVRTTSLPE